MQNVSLIKTVIETESHHQFSPNKQGPPSFQLYFILSDLLGWLIQWD